MRVIKPRKRFGQNFLVDQGLIGKIIRSFDTRPGEQVVEIGPGQGALTEHLVNTGCDLTLVEIDRDLADLLAERFPNVNLMNEDVLKADLPAVISEPPVRVIGNLPYNISTPLMFRLFKHLELFHDMHFMLQLEVVNRMTAEPSTKSYGRLSIMTQLYCQAEKLFEVPPEAFNPRPKVQSAIVRLEPRHRIAQVDTGVIEPMLIQAFSSRRKTIRNALKGLISESELESLGLSPTLRPENLSVEDYIACSNLISARS
ncbi:MAG: 16S rRNA (adenine(1518)-N(6)/adenine(1519)-N(6))-dimethyltransferase RsmA [Pseudomonadales bacterium]|nr:16S rRNA (adenine(1518)-N(6)/adenine(1519)-N(6))-dimethyltransferase RsmA [Pseudomonadales bacterium]MBO6597640.1 16S rRNA (adenine(1518)-N(6)/adenine(1519)-N(6))-dimethyltransferase RsmA [Pseudomonadales bacterium]MBO6658304.1 16S rRNA (adenine(1518)-N(6)/adenine(1519)-N(6))-dimethyltransferase RsmA [Pseudomonadales bacterium]MBO6703955.1 16S rRNA (adenine(1518)-N(6)/adenine(1519)-N(6))-dimethyltransferase RsmA [Pseudomonadales bacterium]MBO6823878.1 16S rRNA (adenine(1518)-N(6)/adenine(151